ncbi:MAG: hypothetical protein JEZ02_10300 [Desulfatibacillum sp.]|nr:hypothetical protein [Desulfatibacillum sp.]
MSRTVTNPPPLIAQETPAWCFAAAEQMARKYLGLDVPSQFKLAYDCLMVLVNAQLNPHFTNYMVACISDAFNNVTADSTPALVALSGNQPNPNSQLVGLISNTWGFVNHNNLNGTMYNACTPQQFWTEIQANRIVIIGSANHYYVVYGYEDTANAPFMLLVRDPMGGHAASIPFTTFNGWANKVVIRF